MSTADLHKTNAQLILILFEAPLAFISSFDDSPCLPPPVRREMYLTPESVEEGLAECVEALYAGCTDRCPLIR